MRRTYRSAVAVIAAAPLGFFALAASSQTINLGNLATSTVANGYQGFNWGNATEDNGISPYYLTGPSAILGGFGRSTPFDLNAVSYQNWESEAPDPVYGETSTYATTISGYRGGTLVDSLTEHYSWSNGVFTGINMDDVTKVTFSTVATLTNSGVTYITAPTRLSSAASR